VLHFLFLRKKNSTQIVIRVAISNRKLSSLVPYVLCSITFVGLWGWRILWDGITLILSMDASYWWFMFRRTESVISRVISRFSTYNYNIICRKSKSKNFSWIFICEMCRTWSWITIKWMKWRCDEVECFKMVSIESRNWNHVK